MSEIAEVLQPTLMSIPLEIRQQIYELLFPPRLFLSPVNPLTLQLFEDTLRYEILVRGDFPPPTFLVSSKMYKESFPLLLKRFVVIEHLRGGYDACVPKAYFRLWSRGYIRLNSASYVLNISCYAGDKFSELRLSKYSCLRTIVLRYDRDFFMKWKSGTFWKRMIAAWSTHLAADRFCGFGQCVKEVISGLLDMYGDDNCVLKHASDLAKEFNVLFDIPRLEMEIMIDQLGIIYADIDAKYNYSSGVTQINVISLTVSKRGRRPQEREFTLIEIQDFLKQKIDRDWATILGDFVPDALMLQELIQHHQHQIYDAPFLTDIRRPEAISAHPQAVKQVVARLLSAQ